MTLSLTERAVAWLKAFEETLNIANPRKFDELFLEQSYWRDLVALTWDIRQFWGREALRQEMLQRASSAQPRNLRLDPDRSGPRLVKSVETPEGAEASVLEVFFRFDLKVGHARGFVQLVLDNSTEHGARALLVATQLIELNCAPIRSLKPHPRLGFEPSGSGQTWGEFIAEKSAFADRDPDVLIIGGGHSGVSIGARLDRMGISYLIIDKNERPGDSWRQRYEALALHTVTPVNDLPYLELPKFFPRYLAKNKWADWVETYAKLMDLSYWSSTTFLGGKFDEDAREWEVRVRRGDGSERTLRPKHIVMAVGGIGTKPNIPDLPGLTDFKGEVLHSSSFKSGNAYRDKNVLVIGTSTSAHDIALDLYRNGASTVTMGQRSPVFVVNISEAELLNVDYIEGRVAREEVDQRRMYGAIYPLMVKRFQAHQLETDRTHAEFYAGLEKAGLKLTTGHDKTGWILQLYREFAGFYLNIGCSDVIVAGGIKVIQTDNVVRYVPEGGLMRDGSVLPLDAIVLATGFQSLSADVEALFGAEMSSKIGHIGGLGADGETPNLARVTRQPHLWIIYGGILDGRRYSSELALQIVAQLRGLVPSFVRQADGRIKALEPMREKVRANA